MPLNDQLVQMGLRARDARRRKNLTLDALSAVTSLSKGHLSRFERGEKSLSMGAILRLAEALEVSIGTLMGENTPENSIHIVRHNERKAIIDNRENGGRLVQALSAPQPGGPDYNIFVLHISEGVWREAGAFHSGREAAYMIRGEAILRIDEHEEVLSAGDFIEFPGYMHHQFKGGPGGAEVLLFVINA